MADQVEKIVCPKCGEAFFTSKTIHFKDEQRVSCKECQTVFAIGIGRHLGQAFERPKASELIIPNPDPAPTPLTATNSREQLLFTAESFAPQPVIRNAVPVHGMQGNSGWGIAGLIFSCMGWFSCGILAIPGFMISFLALFLPGSKSAALAGVIVGAPAAVFCVLMGWITIAGMFTAAAAHDSANEQLRQRKAVVQPLPAKPPGWSNMSDTVKDQ